MAINSQTDVDVKIGIDARAIKSGMQAAVSSVKVNAKGIEVGFGAVSRSADKAGASVARMGQRSKTAAGGMDTLKRRLIAFASVGLVAAQVRSFIALGDQMTLIDARITSLTGSTQKTTEATDQLFSIANTLQVPYQDLAGSFAKLLPAVTNMNGGTTEAIRLAEILAITAKASGASSAEAASTMQQFAQALGQGVLNGDELQSIMANNQIFALRLAEALGTDVGQLKSMGAAGELTAAKISNALLSSYSQIKTESGSMARTVGGAWTQVSNAVARAAGQFAQSSDLVKIIRASFSGLSLVVTETANALWGASDAAHTLSASNLKFWAQSLAQVLGVVADIALSVVYQFQAVAEGLASVLTVASLAAQGDFKIAMIAMEQGAERTAGLVKKAFSQIFGENSIRRRVNVESDVTKEDEPARKLTVTSTGDKKYSEKDDTLRAFMKARIAALKAAQQEFKNNLAERLALAQKEAEFISATYGEQSSQYEAAQGRILAIKRQMVAQANQIEMQAIASAEGALKSQINAEEAAFEEAAQGLAYSHAQKLQMRQDFENRRYQIEAAALERRIALAENDPDANPVTLAKMQADREQMTSDHQTRLAALMRQSSSSSLLVQGYQSAFSQMESGFSSMLQGMANGTLKFRDMWSAMAQGITQILIKTIADMSAKWLMGELFRTTVTGTQAASRTAIEMAAAKKSVAITAWQAVKNIMANAWEAMAGAYKAIAGIPYVGPVLAPVAAGVAFAGVAGLVGNIASARGGYDIPAGVNPITQLHEQEMVLPKGPANAVRQMAKNGGEGGSGNNYSMSWTIQALDGASVASVVENNRDEWSRQIKAMIDDGALSS